MFFYHQLNRCHWVHTFKLPYRRGKKPWRFTKTWHRRGSAGSPLFAPQGDDFGSIVDALPRKIAFLMLETDLFWRRSSCSCCLGMFWGLVRFLDVFLVCNMNFRLNKPPVSVILLWWLKMTELFTRCAQSTLLGLLCVLSFVYWYVAVENPGKLILFVFVVRHLSIQVFAVLDWSSLELLCSTPVLLSKAPWGVLWTIKNLVKLTGMKAFVLHTFWIVLVCTPLTCEHVSPIEFMICLEDHFVWRALDFTLGLWSVSLLPWPFAQRSCQFRAPGVDKDKTIPSPCPAPAGQGKSCQDPSRFSTEKLFASPRPTM